MKENAKNYYHICNPATPEHAGFKNICSQKELQDLKVEDDNAAFLINIHLNWGGRGLDSDYGFEVATHIRTYRKSLLPIIFYSWAPKELFEHKSKKSLKYHLIYGRGSAFLKAPFSIAQLADTVAGTPPLTQSSLHDVVTMLADVKGLVLDKLNHNLRFGHDPLLYFGEVEPYLTEKQKALVGFEEYRRKLIRLSAGGDEQTFREAKDAFLSLCNTTLTESGRAIPEPPAQKHKILVVEDAESELREVTRYLKRSFTVVPVSHAEEAVKILSGDSSNEILAVISDWRLYTDASQSYWQKYQGYEVLEAASKTGSRALFALTSQADFVVHHIRNALDFKFTLIKKQNLKLPDENPEQWLLFSDILHSGCAEALTVIAEMPSSVNWHNSETGVSYKELYLQKKQSLEGFFASVANQADEIWNYLIKQHETNFKHSEDIRVRFGLEVPRESLDLFPVLVLRMIWLALWYKLYGDSVEKNRDEVKTRLSKVFKIICRGGGFSGIIGSADNQELFKLCLTLRDIQQKKILPDERDWLIRKGLIRS
jgi:CheY-like chemotaxis protein